MAFLEIPRYHIGCDTPKCDNAFGIVEYDIIGRPIDHYLVEVSQPVLVQGLIDGLIESEWIVIDNKIYCPKCSTSVTNAVLVTLKTAMGY